MNERLKPFEEKMKKTIGNLDGELSAIRAGPCKSERSE